MAYGGGEDRLGGSNLEACRCGDFPGWSEEWLSSIEVERTLMDDCDHDAR